MSISSTTCRNTYTGNGSVSVYDYVFKLFQASDLQVWVKSNASPAVIVQLAINTDYTVNGVGTRNGGSINLVNNSQAWLNGSGDLISGYQILLIRWPALTQLTDIKNQGAYYAYLHENEFDDIVMLLQMLQDQVSRSAGFGLFDTAGVFNPQLPDGLIGTPGATVVVNSSGNGFAVGAVQSAVSASTIYDAVVGSESGCNYSSLASALAAAQTNWRILVKDSVTINSGAELSVTVPGVLIEFAPGVTYSCGTSTGSLFTINAAGVRIKGGRFSGFVTAITIASSYQYNFITECRFASCTTEVLESDSAPINVIQSNISE